MYNVGYYIVVFVVIVFLLEIENILYNVVLFVSSCRWGEEIEIEVCECSEVCVFWVVGRWGFIEGVVVKFIVSEV